MDKILGVKIQHVGKEANLPQGQVMPINDTTDVKSGFEQGNTTEDITQTDLTKAIYKEIVKGKQNVEEEATKTNKEELRAQIDISMQTAKFPKKVIQKVAESFQEEAVTNTSLNVKSTITQIKVENQTHFSTKLKADKHRCKIVGISITRDGRAILADLNNNKLKMFSNNKNLFLSSVDIPHGPFSVAIINDITAVASAQDKKIHFVEIPSSGDLRIMSTLKLDYKIIGLTSCNSNLVVTTVAEPRGVKMIDWSGKEVWSVEIDKQGNKLFEAPEYLTSFGTHGDQVIVSDFRRETLTLIAGKDGDVLKIIAVPGTGPEGLVADHSGILYVSYYNKSEICAFSPDLMQTAVVLSYPYLLKSFTKMFSTSTFWKCRDWPVDVAYNNVTDELYVCYDNSSNLIDQYKLS